MRTNMDTESSMRRDISNLLQLRKTIDVFRARRYASTHYICVHLNFNVFVKRIEAVKKGTEEGTRRGMRKPLCVTLYILKEDCIGTIFRNQRMNTFECLNLLLKLIHILSENRD